MHLLGGDEREALGQVEAHLVAEHAAGAGAGAVGLLHPGVEDALEEVEVRLHDLTLEPRTDDASGTRAEVLVGPVRLSAPSASAARCAQCGSRSSSRARNTASASPSPTIFSACCGSVIRPTAATGSPDASRIRVANGTW